MRTDLPSGTVTFLFTDVEGSTKLLHEQGGEEYSRALTEHRRVLREAFGANQGVEVDTQGDAFFVAFPTAPGALGAAAVASAGLAAGPIRVRMGIHTGTPHLGEEGYVGIDVHRAARIAACGHGGQVLVSASSAALVGTGGLRDLGEHRLKDLSVPERIYQLGDGDFPPLKTLQETNLPVPATPFLGREREIDQIAELLCRSDVRLVTLTGPGGSGKTRLSLQAAAAVADDYDHGVWWVPLASLADSNLVETVVAQTLGSKDTLSATVGDKRLLLVLDNFEHLLAAAADVAETIGSCPHLTVLVTSREPLHVDGEWEVAVDPLREREAVELFTQRAAAVRSDFVANGEVVEICRRLDCLPLAIELAAARVKALSLPVLLERLEQRLPLLAGGPRSAPERQRTLRATIAWSHDLLTVAEQVLFARLAVFAGGCTLEAAEEICGADLDVIASLVDKSLVRRTGDRYWMLETIREYASEQLDQLVDREELRGAHAAWYTALGERAAPELHGREGRGWLDRLEAEHANLRAALEHLVALGDGRGALRLVASIWYFWTVRGNLTEGRQLLEATLAVGADGDPQHLIEALWGAAILAIWQGEPDEGERCGSRILELAEQNRLERGEAIGMHVLAIAAHESGGLDKARPLYEQALKRARTIDDAWFLSVATNNLGTLHSSEGDYARAAELFEESLAIGEALGDLDRRARQLSNLGSVKYELGDKDAALDLYRRALAAAVEIGTVIVQCQSLSGIAVCEAEAGNVVDAARLVGRHDALESRIGLVEDDDGERERTVAMIAAALGHDRLAAELAIGAALSPGETLDLALGQNESATPT